MILSTVRVLRCCLLEFDLQLFTRRLHAWRQLAGAESWWHDLLGEQLVARGSGLALDLLRSTTDIEENTR